MEFDLRFQEFIELARERRLLDAIAYQRKYLVQWQDTHMPQIHQASALLAFPPYTTCGQYKVHLKKSSVPGSLSYIRLTPFVWQRLYDPSRWKTLAESFRLAIYNLSTLPTEPLLHLAMYAGLASLKLPACYDEHTKNVDCPVCDADLGLLAKEVPLSHHVNSTIVCGITGKIMDEDNSPMAFPGGGNVYSKEVSLCLSSLFRR